MSNSNNIVGQGPSNPLPEKVSSQANLPPPDQLPSFLVRHILSYVNDSSTEQSTALVNKLWNKQAVKVVGDKEWSLIQNLTEFLSENLNKISYACQIEQLVDIVNVNKTKILSSVNLITLKSSTDQVKNAIINILKSLEMVDLNALEKLYKNTAKSNFFEDIFYLARFYKKIDIANQIFNEDTRLETLESIIKDFMRDNKHDIDKSERIIDKIPDEFAKGVALHAIVKTLLPIAFDRLAKGQEVIDRSKIDRAKVIADKIPNDYTRGLALLRVVDELILRHEFDDAERTADEIPNSDPRRYYAFSEISTALTERKDWDRAVANAVKISDESARGRQLTPIVNRLIKLGHFDQANIVADKIPDEHARGDALQSIVNRLIKLKRFDEAIATCNKITDAHTRKETAEKIERARPR